MSPARTARSDEAPFDPRAFLRREAPWLLAPELGVCVVGSMALAEACRRAAVDGPAAQDLDLAWPLDVAAGTALLREHGVLRETTEANRARGTLAMKLGERRVEVTSFRGEAHGAPLAAQIEADLAARDMTVGALAWIVADDRLLDPFGGLADWRARRVVPVGDPSQRVREHPVRWVRYYRRAHQWGFALAPSVRALRAEPGVLAAIPPEALAAELRAALLHCASPGRLLADLHAAGLLPLLAPELAPQFDGRPAGPLRHHPEGSQAEHLALALEWAAQRTAARPEGDRVAVMVAVLCHDLGKGRTEPSAFPAHRGHEEAGVPWIAALLDRLPGLADAPVRHLAVAVSRLHLTIRQFERLRPGTRARLYDRWFRHASFRADLFALAVGADAGGRTGRAAEGEAVARQVEADIAWLRTRCGAVDAAALRARFGAGTVAFRDALHRARVQALRASPAR